jgi:hypothetical protein
MKTLGADPAESANHHAYDLAVDAQCTWPCRPPGPRARASPGCSSPRRCRCDGSAWTSARRAEYDATVRRLSDAGNYAYVSARQPPPAVGPDVSGGGAGRSPALRHGAHGRRPEIAAILDGPRSSWTRPLAWRSPSCRRRRRLSLKAQARSTPREAAFWFCSAHLGRHLGGLDRSGFYRTRSKGYKLSPGWPAAYIPAISSLNDHFTRLSK